MPKNWKTYKLGDIAKLRKEGIKPSDFNGEKYIGLEHIGQGNFLLNGIGKASDVTSNKSKFIKGDILYGKIRPYFKKVYRPKFSGICSTDILIINTKNEDLVSQNYLHQFIKNQEFTDKATETSTGTKMPRADWNSLKLWAVQLPPLKEQKAIANILSGIDDKIENNLAINKTLEEMAMALYKHWFVDFNFPITKESHPELVSGSQTIGYKNAGGEFVDSELGKIPKGWEVKRLDEVAYKNSKTFDFKGKEKVVFVNTGDVQYGSFLHKNYSKTEGLPGQAKKVIEPNDILFSEIRPKNKRYVFVDFDSSEYVVSTKFMIIRNNEKINNKLLYRILTRQETIDEFQMIAESRSGTFPQITFDAIGHFPITLPNIEIQNKFQSIVEPLENQQSSNLNEGKYLTKLRDTLLPKLISGEIRLKEFQEKVENVIARNEAISS